MIKFLKASAYAAVIAELGSLAHADNLQELGQGENLAFSFSSEGPVVDYANAVDRWYNEIDDPGPDSFTQIFKSLFTTMFTKNI